MKKILVLGAGVYQVPLIRKAKELGYKTIVASRKGNYPGWDFADKKYYIDTTDAKKLLTMAKKEKISGVCTSGTDVAILAQGIINDQLKLPGISARTGELSTNKYAMKTAFIKNKVRTAHFIDVRTLEEATAACSKLKFPVYFKVLDSSGSRGTIKVSTSSEIKSAYIKITKSTKLDHFIIEEFIEGHEFGAQALVQKGEIKFIMPHGDVLYHGKSHTVPIGHYVPIKLNKAIQKDLKLQIEKSIKALEIEDSAVNIDLISRDNKVYILEIGARAGATCLTELVSTYYGIDYYKEIINLAMGKPFKLKENPKQPCAGILLTSKKTGTINKISIPEIHENPDIIDISIDYKPGNKIKKFEVGPDRIGQIITKGKTAETALKLANKIENYILYIS